MGKVVIPGDCVSSTAANLLNGYGVYKEDGVLYSSIMGQLERINQLIYVRPLKGRYIPQVGDIVVGRIDEIVGNKWMVEIGTIERAQLSIFQINLGELSGRRRLTEDLYDMCNIFSNDDLVSCEVQRVMSEGTTLLQIRSEKLGKLMNGLLLTIHPYLVKRQSRHIYVFDFGIQITLGCNGNIWLCPSDPNSPLSYSDRQNISIVRALVLTIASHFIIIHFDIINEMYKIFFKNGYKIQNFDIYTHGTDILKEYLTLQN